MLNLPLFFQQHELAADADERAIKRAYAKNLKQIDQENDLAGFQALRESYEEALQWLQWHSNETVEDSISVHPLDDADAAASQPVLDAHAQLAGINATAIAQQILDDMLQDLRLYFEQDGYAGSRLQQALDDMRLIHMETRLAFEQLIANYLAQGWQSGNGELFDVAMDCFGWKKDRRRLFDLGKAGYLIDRALAELIVFNSKPQILREGQWAMLRKARAEQYPGRDYLKLHFPLMSRLVDMYPTWVVLVSSKQNIEQWYTTAAAMPETDFAKPAPQEIATEKTGMSDKLKLNIMLWVGFIVLLLLVGIFSDHNKDTPYPVPPPAPKFEQRKLNETQQILEDAIKRNSGINRPDSTRQDAADRNLTAAQLLEKGENFFAGHGGERININEAIRYWVLASEAGEAKASYQLGWIYDVGNQVPQDNTVANKWYLKAAEQGSNIAQLKMAVLYDQQKGVMRDTKQIVKWLTLAAENGNPTAESNLGTIYLYGTYDQKKDELKAAYWFERSAKQNNYAGQRMLGLMHEEGRGGYAHDPVLAAQWYAKAVAQGDPEATRLLKALCSKSISPACK
ncbi:tetratricopeptide repeat protein [Undibacterium sp. TJN19]|uniref:tetratricopeptide repeat protein n=1 Tax=Undibacterium sp. TJN19 TaxID=3413055 RepID=UPI003BF11DF5